MSDGFDTLKKEDYEESCCPLQDPNKKESIPLDRIIDKLDEYLGKNDYAGAKRHLEYWVNEAKAIGDDRGRLSLLNEQVGVFRKTGVKDLAISTGKHATALAAKIGLADSITMGTTLVNLATALKAFDEDEDAIKCYEKARGLYEKYLEKDDYRLAGLYNNMGLCFVDLGKFDEGIDSFEKAIEILALNPDSKVDIAVTYCNIAQCCEKKNGLDRGEDDIAHFLGLAKDILYSEDIKKDYHYAFVCEKCSSAFGYYGYFEDEQKLLKIAEDIRERN